MFNYHLIEFNSDHKGDYWSSFGDLFLWSLVHFKWPRVRFLGQSSLIGWVWKLLRTLVQSKQVNSGQPADGVTSRGSDVKQESDLKKRKWCPTAWIQIIWGVRRCFTYIFWIYQALPLDEPGFLVIIICWSICGNKITLNKQLLHCDVVLDDPDVAAPKKERTSLFRPPSWCIDWWNLIKAVGFIGRWFTECEIWLRASWGPSEANQEQL